jgi:hypothetical protein
MKLLFFFEKYSGYPLAYVQHIVIRCSSSTSRSSCLLRARDIRDRLFSDSQFDKNCLRVSEPINAQQMSSYLPSFGCLFLSPLNLWSNHLSNIINNEQEILESIPSLSKRYADIIFGIPQEYISSKKPFNYAITLLLNNASIQYRQDLKRQLSALDEQQQQQHDIIHIYFSRKSLLYYLPLLLIYIVVFLYIYYSVCKLYSFERILTISSLGSYDKNTRVSITRKNKMICDWLFFLFDILY